MSTQNCSVSFFVPTPHIHHAFIIILDTINAIKPLWLWYILLNNSNFMSIIWALVFWHIFKVGHIWSQPIIFGSLIHSLGPCLKCLSFCSFLLCLVIFSLSSSSSKSWLSARCLAFCVVTCPSRTCPCCLCCPCLAPCCLAQVWRPGDCPVVLHSVSSPLSPSAHVLEQPQELQAEPAQSSRCDPFLWKYELDTMTQGIEDGDKRIEWFKDLG